MALYALAVLVRVFALPDLATATYPALAVRRVLRLDSEGGARLRIRPERFDHRRERFRCFLCARLNGTTGAWSIGSASRQELDRR